MSEWIENTGVVPEGVTADTALEVMYRDAYKTIWNVGDPVPNDDPEIWELRDNAFDVIMYRFL